MATTWVEDLGGWAKERIEDITGKNTQEALAPFRDLARADRDRAYSQADQYRDEYAAMDYGLPVARPLVHDNSMFSRAPVLPPGAGDPGAAPGGAPVISYREMGAPAAAQSAGAAGSAAPGWNQPQWQTPAAPSGGRYVEPQRPVGFYSGDRPQTTYTEGAPRGAEYGFHRGWRAQQIGDSTIGSQDLTGAMGLFRGAAEGTAPSAAAMQQAMAQNQIVRDQAAIAAQARGADAAGARRAQMMAMGDQGQQAALQAAMLRAQEMAQARGQYGQAAQSLATEQAQLDLKRRGANQEADLRGMQMFSAERESLRNARGAAEQRGAQGTGMGLGIALGGAQAAQQGSAAIGSGVGTTIQSMFGQDDQ